MQSFCLVRVGAALLLFATEAAFSQEPSQSPIHEINSGDKRRAAQAIVDIAEEREGRIIGFRKMFEAAKAQDNYITGGAALRAIGAMKAIEAIDLLIENLSYASPEDKATLWRDQIVLLHNVYPALDAIDRIGPSCTHDLLKAVATRDMAKDEVSTIGWLVARWFGTEDGLKIIEGFKLTLRPEVQRKRLDAAPLIKYFVNVKKATEPDRK